MSYNVTSPATPYVAGEAAHTLQATSPERQNRMHLHITREMLTVLAAWPFRRMHRKHRGPYDYPFRKTGRV